MKLMHFFLITILLLIFASPIYAISFLGPPCSPLSQGQSSVRLSWTTAETDISFDYATYAPDVAIDLITSRFATSLFDRSEIYGLIGFGRIEDYDHDLAWGGGIKFRTSQLGELSSGFLAQVTFLHGEESVNSMGFEVADELDMIVIQLVPGLVIGSEPLYFYGGPTFQFFTGDFEFSMTGMGTGSVGVDEEVQFGGYVGLSWILADNFALNTEFQLNEMGWMAGFQLDIRFGQPKSYWQRTQPPIYHSPWPKPRRSKIRGREYQLKRDEKGGIIFELDQK